jgi:hypothetical protein
MLKFLSEWLIRDPGRLAASLAQFVGHPAYGQDALRGDLEQFVFLLGERRPGTIRRMTKQTFQPARAIPGAVRRSRCGHSDSRYIHGA